MVTRGLVLNGDCRALMCGPFDMIIADPPYGDTALAWDQKVRGWEAVALAALKPGGSLWVFGSMRYFMVEGVPRGFRLAQDIVWEKHNGSGFAADRFKRVHEHVVQFYRADAPWAGVYNDVQRVPGEVNPSKNIKSRAAGSHLNKIGLAGYEYGPTRIARSVLKVKAPRDGKHKTQKPVELLEMLIRTSCPLAGLVGDFFAGSGAVGEERSLADRNYIGCEIDAAMASAANARLENVHARP